MCLSLRAKKTKPINAIQWQLANESLATLLGFSPEVANPSTDFAMSAFGGKADIDVKGFYFCFSPKAGMAIGPQSNSAKPTSACHVSERRSAWRLRIK